LDELDARLVQVSVQPDPAGFQDLAHAFDLRAFALAARATLDVALKRRETRGGHNRSTAPGSTSRASGVERC
jgi:succinate dehydrogenase / fumarate reductase flavoprotein subunit